MSSYLYALVSNYFGFALAFTMGFTRCTCNFFSFRGPTLSASTVSLLKNPSRLFSRSPARTF